MEFLVASSIGLLTACGVYMLLRGRTFPVVIGLSLLSYAVVGFFGNALPFALIGWSEQTLDSSMVAILIFVITKFLPTYQCFPS